MADDKDQKSPLIDKRAELGVRAAEVELEIMKLNRQLLKEGHSVADLVKLKDALFDW